MTLFPEVLSGPLSLSPLTVQTPLGKIGVEGILNTEALDIVHATTIQNLSGAGMQVHWSTPRYECTLLCCRPALLREEWTTVSDCWAFLWRLRAVEQLEAVAFRAGWTGEITSTDGGPSDGEGLAAQTWSNVETMVTVGSEGVDALYRRAQRGDWLPERYLALAGDHGLLPLVKHTLNGLQVDFDVVQAGDGVQAQFVIAWSPFAEESAETWFAVWMDQRRIIAGARGTTIWPASM